MNPFRCPCIKFQKGRSGCGERKRFHLREITRVCQTERNVLLHSPTYKKWRFPSSGECGASLRRHFVSLSRSFFFLPPHPSDPHGEGKSAEFLLPLNAH